MKTDLQSVWMEQLMELKKEKIEVKVEQQKL